MSKSQINLENSAFLIMDYQLFALQNYLPEEAAQNIIKNTKKLLGTIHNKNIPVIYITVQFNDGYPEISSKNTVFSQIKEQGLFKKNDPLTQIHPDIKPNINDIEVTRNRIGSFSFTNLDLILKANKIDTLILAGLTTSGVVLSTVRQAFDLDYKLIVIEDCCSDPDPDIQEILMKKILPQHSSVLSINEAINLCAYIR